MPEVLVQSVKRALDALDYIAGECVAADGVRLRDVAGHLDLKPTTLRNILRTMEACGYIGRTGDRLYRPGPRCRRLAFGAASVQALLQTARPAMHELAERTGESLVLTCLAGGVRRVLARHQGGHLVTVNAERMDEGDPYTLVTTRVLLAHAHPDEVRRFVDECGAPRGRWDGAATVEQVVEAAARLRDRQVVEYHPSDDVVALASPVDSGAAGVPVALGMFLPRLRYDPERGAELRDALAATTRRISREMQTNEPEL
jgi:IclR family acetate operon transcriptional repressor